MSTFTTNKWMGTNAIYFSSPGIPDDALLEYMETNKIGCWIYDGNMANLSTFQSDCSSMFSKIQNNYTIPIGLNLNAISESIGIQYDDTWTSAQYDALAGASLNWAIDTYPCINMLWYENGFPRFGSWLWGAATNQSSMTWKGAQAKGVKVGMGIYNYWTSQNANYTNPMAPVCNNGWLCGSPASVPLSTRFAQCDWVSPEFWYQSDVSIMLNLIQYIRGTYPHMPIYWDSQCQGGAVGPGHIWGATDTSASPGNYATIRGIFKTKMTQAAVVAGLFDGAVMEFNGDSDGSVTGGSTDAIIESQLDYMIGCNLIKGGGNTTTYLGCTSNSASVGVTDPAVTTQITMITPATATTGVAFTVTGVLSTTAGAGIANQTVHIGSKTATTNASGVYSISVTETTAGTYTYQAVYAGGTV